MISASASADDSGADGGKAAPSHRMAGDPFQSWCDESAWYPDPTRENSLKLLLHLAPYSDLLLVTGESGSGKSLFIKKFIAGAGDTWRVLSLPGGPALDDISLLESLDQELSVRPDGDADREERLRRLRRGLFVLRRGALLPVLVVDDAHLLPSSAFQFLVELTEPREDGEKPIAVVLAGEASALGSRIEGVGDRLQARVAHVFELQALTEAGTGAYIRHRLALAGMETSTAFTPAVVRYIHTASRGLPSRINEFARVVLEEGQRRLRRKEDGAVGGAAGPSDAGILLRYGFAALVVALAGVALVYREELSTLMRDDRGSSVVGSAATVREPTDSVEVLFGDSAPDPEVPGKLPDNSDVFLDLEGGSAEAVTEIFEGDRELSDSDGVLSVDESRVEEAESGVSVASADRQEERTSAKAPAPLRVPEEPGVVGTPDGPEVVAGKGPQGASAAQSPGTEDPWAPRREAWLLAQAPHTWTVQLFASREERLLALIEEHRLESGAAVFRARSGDPALYALVWGLFSSREEANQAIEGDLAHIAGLKPWVRSMGDIQAAIASQESGG